MLEIVVVSAILLVCALPMIQLLTSSSRMQERSIRNTYAHFIARRVLESALAKSNQEGFAGILTHDQYLSAINNEKVGTSPYFQNFGSNGNGITQNEYPYLHKVLSHYQFRFVLTAVKGQEGNSMLRNALVEVRWEAANGIGSGSLVLQTILSRVPLI